MVESSDSERVGPSATLVPGYEIDDDPMDLTLSSLSHQMLQVRLQLQLLDSHPHQLQLHNDALNRPLTNKVDVFHVQPMMIYR